MDAILYPDPNPNPNRKPDPAATPTPDPTRPQAPAARGEIDVDRAVRDLCAENPALIGAMQSLGFTEIVKPGMLTTAGRFMTLRKGAALKRIPMKAIETELAARGFTVINKEAHP